MAGEALQVIRLKDDFYRDGFNKVLLALGMILVAIGLLIAASLYLFLSKPAPVFFATDNEWRVISPVPVNQPYLSTSEVLQWVNHAVQSSFTYDYINYSRELNKNKQFFTEEGLKKYIDLLNRYAAYETILASKTFINASASKAPYIDKQGLLPEGRYGWWVIMPLKIQFSGYQRIYSQSVNFSVLVVRIPTLNDINGIAIDNISLPSQGKTPEGGANVQ